MILKFKIDNINSEVESETWIFENTGKDSSFYPEQVLWPHHYERGKMVPEEDSTWQKTPDKLKRGYYIWRNFIPSEEELKEIIKQWQKKENAE